MTAAIDIQTFNVKGDIRMMFTTIPTNCLIKLYIIVLFLQNATIKSVIPCFSVFA